MSCAAGLSGSGHRGLLCVGCDVRPCSLLCAGSMQVIRYLLTPETYVIGVEHDVAVLDYLSDFICCLYGKPQGSSLTPLVPLCR